MRSSRIVIIGAGPGGLSAAMLLAAKGYSVDVLEQHHEVGGRTSPLQLGPYTFDRGPTFLNMPHILEDVFKEAGRSVHDYVTLKQLDPMYRLLFDDAPFYIYKDRGQMIREIGQMFPGNEDGYVKFMEREGKKLAALTPVLQNKHDSLLDYLRPKFLKALPQLTVGRTLYDCLSDYFDDERLRLAFTFQAKYLGMSPWDCPGAFSILSYMEHEYGISHPIGGVHKITEAMADVVREYGGRIHLGRGVKQLVLAGRKVKGVLTNDGDVIEADEVIVNADFAHAITKLVEPGTLRRTSSWTAERLARKSYSCSTFMLYLGLNRTYDQPHHTIMMPADYKRNVEEISRLKVLSDDPSIYVQNASVTDPTLAPPGHSALYVLAPVPNNFSGIDWEREKHSFRDKVLDKVERLAGFEGLRHHIEAEHMITPLDWEHKHRIYQGATFNLAHNLGQMLYFRPHNRFDELDGCWLVGGGTHPGSGLPTIMESARITARGIAAKYDGERVPVVTMASSVQPAKSVRTASSQQVAKSSFAESIQTVEASKEAGLRG
ncbi:NAD(P)/FAD-dependent oxidoreductase [Paenibacillus sp. YYML68]|uniref:phytoene desaturase family protein n=1 Tax=Paenibacillus sp. YYML68 TaxID=2909250 RepID=UPI0024911818|nr:phytoene desaturase family protein [Paenibacillus sp. YYML68]